MRRTLPNPKLNQLAQYYALTKPRVTQLAVFCAVIGMFLASRDMPPWPLVLAAAAGIWLLAGAAFAVNCVIEQHIDARMSRTHQRPMPQGAISTARALVFSLLIGSVGAGLLYVQVNALTMWLTLATFVGYAVIYTMLLKPATPQNIVIGGLSGAMPPALGWAAVADAVPVQAWLLVLIIFVWTPPHFWALALYRHKDYEHSGLPMLPVTHGAAFTRLHVLLYSIALFAATLLPYAIKMSGVFYLSAAVVLGAWFVMYGWKIYRDYSDALAQRMFRFSIVYLSLLFGALLIDHYLPY